VLVDFVEFVVGLVWLCWSCGCDFVDVVEEFAAEVVFFVVEVVGWVDCVEDELFCFEWLVDVDLVLVRVFGERVVFI